MLQKSNTPYVTHNDPLFQHAKDEPPISTTLGGDAEQRILIILRFLLRFFT